MSKTLFLMTCLTAATLFLGIMPISIAQRLFADKSYQPTCWNADAFEL